MTWPQILFNLNTIEYEFSVLFNPNIVKPRWYLIMLSLLITPIPYSLRGVAFSLVHIPNIGGGISQSACSRLQRTGDRPPARKIWMNVLTIKL